MDSTMNMDMGSMDMGAGIPNLPVLQRWYWSAIGAMIVFATLVNVLNYVVYRQRLRAASKGLPTPAKPKSWFFVANATATALVREASHASFMPFSVRGRLIRTPTFGRAFLVGVYVMVLMVFCFFMLDPANRWEWEDIGYRTGWMSICQLPLVFLLAGKNNIIGYLTGASYERLNWMHRWAARGLILTTTIHAAFWLKDWWPYGNYPAQMIKTDYQANKGFIAWILILWIGISSSAPIRGWRYEFFVIQHLISFTALIAYIYLHAFPETRWWIWLPVGIFFFDRTLRGVLAIYTNFSIFHPKQRKLGNMSGLWACKAEFIPQPHNTTKIIIRNPPISWSPGQHVFVSCHSIVPLQSHPFTIASLPSDREMVFMVKAENGGTRHFFHHAEKQSNRPQNAQRKGTEVNAVAIQGPYGCVRPLRQFDSVVFFAGSTGATFTMPLLRDLIRHWKGTAEKPFSFFQAPAGAVTRHIRFVWIVKSRRQLEYFSVQLNDAMEDMRFVKERHPDHSLEISIYVTCDNEFTDESMSIASSTPSQRPQTPASSYESIEEISPDAQPDEVNTEKSEIETATREIDSRLTTCCCKTTIQDEDPAATKQCCCNTSKKPVSKPAPARSIASTVSSESRASGPSTPLHSSIPVLVGRPQCRNIIRRSLEQALGESAVVVCGPKGLVGDVKSSVVALSDERAVHKGTGAQGIYLHTESFCF